MKQTLLVLALTLSLLRFQAAQAQSCDDAQSQAALDACAARAYKASDAELNALYKKIENRLADDKDTWKRLTKAQHAWLGFRDAECGFSSSGVEGGSVYPTILSMCLDDLTSKRIEDFKGYLSCEEGDMSCPIPAGAQADAGATLGFDVTLSFSPKALKTLSERNEKVIASARYYGGSKPSAKKHADDVGQIQLGTEDVEVAPKPGEVVHLTGANVTAERLDWIQSDIMVNVNVLTARKSSPDNLINCDVIDGKLAAVTPSPVALHCALIEEKYDTKLKP